MFCKKIGQQEAFPSANDFCHLPKFFSNVTKLQRCRGEDLKVYSVLSGNNRELKIETFSGRRQLQPDVTSSFVGYCACSCSPPRRRGPVGDVKLVCLALWRKREYLTFISIRFVAFSNQHFADYRS